MFNNVSQAKPSITWLELDKYFIKVIRHNIEMTKETTVVRFEALPMVNLLYIRLNDNVVHSGIQLDI